MTIFESVWSILEQFCKIFMKELRFSASYLPDFASIAFVSQRVALNSSAFNRLASWGAAVSLCVYNQFCITFSMLVFASFFNRFFIDSWTLRTSKSMFFLRKNKVFHKTTFHGKVDFLNDFGTILASFLDHFGIIFRSFFGIDFRIDFL